MKKFKDDTEILQPKNQLFLFGYKYVSPKEAMSNV